MQRCIRCGIVLPLVEFDEHPRGEGGRLATCRQCLQPVPCERSWRDVELSKRHRTWGWSLPAVDLDHVVVEYDLGMPMALIEYKHERARPLARSHPSCRALAALANAASLPLFVVRYAADFAWLKVQPVTELARGIVPSSTTMSERDYVALLYQLRGRPAPSGDSLTRDSGCDTRVAP